MEKTLRPLRRIASSEVITPDGNCLTRYVIELSEGCVTKLYPLQQELPFTEWFQGRVVLTQSPDDDKVRAYYQGQPIM